MVAPTKYIKTSRLQKHKPELNLVLEWVHGYRAKDCRNNLRYLPDGKIIYHAAGLGIVYDKVTNSQTFFNLHTDNITAFALDKSGTLCATGETSKVPAVYVWDTRTMKTVAKFKGDFKVGIMAMNFSPTGKYLGVVGKDSDHLIAVYDVNTNSKVFCIKGDPAEILDINFIDEQSLVSIGIKHYKYWTVNNANPIIKRGIFGKF